MSPRRHRSRIESAIAEHAYAKEGAEETAEPARTMPRGLVADGRARAAVPAHGRQRRGPALARARGRHRHRGAVSRQPHDERRAPGRPCAAPRAPPGRPVRARRGRGRERRRPQRHPPGLHRGLLLPLAADGDRPHQPDAASRAWCGADRRVAHRRRVYEVKLYNHSGELVTHHVDDRFITNADGTPRYAQYGDRPPSGPELWVMLMEKAWAAQRGGFNNMDFGQASDGLMAVTGKSSHLAQDRHREHQPDPHRTSPRRTQTASPSSPTPRRPSPARRSPGRPRPASRSSKPLLQRRRARTGPTTHDRRPEPARRATTCPASPSGDFRMIFEWYRIARRVRCNEAPAARDGADARSSGAVGRRRRTSGSASRSATTGRPRSTPRSRSTRNRRSTSRRARSSSSPARAGASSRSSRTPCTAAAT